MTEPHGKLRCWPASPGPGCSGPLRTAGAWLPLPGDLPPVFSVTARQRATPPAFSSGLSLTLGSFLLRPDPMEVHLPSSLAFQMALVVKNPSADAGDVTDPGPTPGSGRSPGGGNGNPLQCSYLENPMDRGAWKATVQGSQRARHDRRDLAHALPFPLQPSRHCGFVSPSSVSPLKASAHFVLHF